MELRLNRANPITIAVIAIIAAGVLLRGYGMHWDEGLYLHPDERFIAIVSSERVDLPGRDNLSALLDPGNSPLNPRRDGDNGRPLSFAYGTLPIYVQSVASWAVNFVTDNDHQTYQHVYKVGRPLTVLMDTLTMVFVFLLARRLFGDTAAVVATALYAFSVLAIQLSHFFTVDVWLTSFVTASLFFAIRYVDKPTLGRALTMGVPVGLAFATKASVPALLLPLLVATGWTVWRSEERQRAFLHVCGAGAVALAAFTVFEPYAIVRARPFIEDIALQSRIVRGHNDVPFTRQFVGLTPGLYELKNLARYTLGPAFTLAGLLGVVFATQRAIRMRDIALCIPLAWVVAYVPTIVLTEAKFLRYALPLVPVLAVLAGGLLTVGLARYSRNVSLVAVALVLGITAIWAIGFASIYAHEHTRIAASKWMHANIPPGSAVSVESWDDALPLPYRGAPPMSYRQVGFDVYGDEPPEQKVETLASLLQSVDYVILSSNRLIDSVDNLPWRYAVQNEYYRRLLDGQLGFRLVYDGQVQPSLFGYRYDDSGSDESFTVYDHPRVLIFQKVEDFSTAEVRERLLWGIEQPWIPQRYAPEETLRLAVPVGEIQSTRDAGWNSIGVDSGLAAMAFWLLAIEAIGLAVLPITALVLRRTPDRGAFSARLLGLLVVGWLGWLGASIGLWQSRALLYVLVVLAVGLGCWGWWSLRGRSTDLPTRRMYVLGAGIWLGVFGYFVTLRALYPDFWQTWFGGEKPFELAYLRAVAQSTSFPPYDPWFSDGTINYYYYGWQLVSTVTKISGVGIDHSFQLALATFAGFVALQAATVGAMLLRRGRQRLPVRTTTAGAAAIVFATLFAGNLDAAYQMVGERALLADTFDFWRSTRVISYTINEFPYFSYLWADVHPHIANVPILLLLLTLVAHMAASGGLQLNRQLLAPLALLTLVLGTVGVTNSWDLPLAIGLTVAALGYLGLQRSVRAGLAGAALGVLVTAASFVLFAPFYLGFYSVVEGIKRSSGGSRLGEFLVVWGIFFLILTLATASEAVARSRDSTGIRDGLALAVVTLAVGTVAQAIDAINGGVGAPYRDVAGALVLGALVMGLAAAATIPSRFERWALALVALLGVGAGSMVTYRPAATVALAFVALATMYAYRVRRQPTRFIPWALIGVAITILAATEIIYVADDLQRSPWERMNTIFKFYMQAWLLLAVGAGIVLTRLVQQSRWNLTGPRWRNDAPLGLTATTPKADKARRVDAANPGRPRVRHALAGVALFVLLLGGAYPLAGTPVRLNQDMPTSPTGLTLDGYAWMNGGYIHNHTGEVIEFSGDLAAIRWLNDNEHGTPVILEASIGPYRGNGSRISSATGLPTVLGWDRHQRQQRYGPEISQRMADVRWIYNETDVLEKMEMLRRYRVEYVVVGDVERFWNSGDDTTHYASEEGLAAFEAMIGRGLTVAFESGTTRVYRVDAFPRLAPTPDAVRRL